MTIEPLVAGSLFGLANAAHCAGMCGVFALRAASRKPATLRTALYLTGKTFTYVFLGAIAGVLGARVLGSFTGAQTALGIAVGGVLLLAAWRMLRPPALDTTGRGFRAWFARLLLPVFRAAHGAEKHGGPFALGAATGFLPCGVTYLAALQAAALGNAADGALLMAAFGIGTMPVLAATGLFGRGAIARLGPARVRTAGGLLLALAGTVALVRALLPLTAPDGGAVCLH